MFCPWCGMESATTDQCSWCHRSFATSPAEEKSEESPAPIASAEAAAPLTADVAAEKETEESLVAPWTVAPPVPAPEAPKPPSDVLANAPDRLPIIGIRKPGGRTNAPAPGAPPARSAGKEGARPPAPAYAPPANRAGKTPAPAIVPPRPGTANPATPPVTRPAVPAASVGTPGAPSAGGAVPPVVNVAATAGVAPVIRTETAEPPIEESGGLADGVAMPNRPSQTPADLRVPAMGTFTPAKSKYYTDQVVDPLSGTHYDAATGQAVATPDVVRQKEREDEIKIEWIENQTTLKTRILRYLGAFILVLIVTGLIAYFSPATYVAPLLIGQFVAAILMPAMRAVPFADEDSDDVGLLVLTLIVGSFVMLCGPAVALIFYGVIALLRQNANPAVVGCLLVATLCRLMVESVTGGLTTGLFSPFVGAEMLKPLLVNFSAFITIAGWYAGNVFHKLDE